jgi:pyruvate dehydrogenase E2 component (dihydrolipoamide acetyltransferase)
VAATGADRTLTVASPRARRVASELGVDWPSLRGTGRHGRVREQDVRRAAAACATVAAASEPAKPLRQPQPAPTGVGTPITKRRRVIAQRMLASHQTTVPVTLTTRADAANLQGAREQFKAIGEAAIVPTISDIVIKLAAVVLRKHRLLAGRWRDDQLVLPADNELDIGLAVDTDDGLLVPVVRDVAGRSLMEIARTTAQLVQRARAGTLALEQLQGSVFTITNLGAFGIDAFTPVINPPEVAILGIGAIRREAIVQDDQRLAVGSRMTLSLTFDHRMVDGAPAARFLADVRGAIEHPVPYLV